MPQIKKQTSQIDSWNTYTNAKYGYEIKYPSNFIKTSINCDYSNESDGIKRIDTTAVSFGTDDPKIDPGMGFYICNENEKYTDVKISLLEQYNH